MIKKRSNNLVKRDLTLTTSPAPIYGCAGLFDPMGNLDLMSLSFQGAAPFLDWIGWTPTNVCTEIRGFINWVRPARSQGGRSLGYVSDPCAPGNSVEYGIGEFMVDGFARLRRPAPTRDVTRSKNLLYGRQPRYRVDGSPVTDEREFNQLLSTEVIMQDTLRMIISGDGSVSGQFSGLEQLVTNGYTDYKGRRLASMDSVVIDWNGSDIGAGSGVTWNGQAVSGTPSLYTILRHVLRTFKYRIQFAPMLAAQRLRVGDIALVMPSFMISEFLDQVTCFEVCNGASSIDTLEARQYRNSLNGGQFGWGQFMIDGLEVPIIAHDYETIKNAGGTLGDVYLLTGSVGNIKTLYGEYNEMTSVPADYPEANYYVTDGGKFLNWITTDETCVQQSTEFQPRLVSWAPFLNARFQNVRASVPGGAMSPDPDSSFFWESSFTIAGN